MSNLDRYRDRRPALSLPAAVVGALAFGAIAIGAIAIARLAIGRMSVKKAKFGSVEIDELTVRRLCVLEDTRDARNEPVEAASAIAAPR